MRRIDSLAPGWSAGLGLFLALAFRTIAAPEGIPAAAEKSRYDALRTHSPFAVATAEAPPVLQVSFAANWYVSGIGRIGDADFVSIKSRDLKTAFSLYGREEDHATHVALASVSWSDSVGKSTVILRKGTETARLEFNEAEIRAAAATPGLATPANAGPGGPPGRSAPLTTAPRPPNFAGGGTPPPMPPGTIHRRVVPIQPPR
jgi:hypothetical protein